MPREWMDVSHLSFNTLLLLEQVQLSWLPGWLPENDLRIALRANCAKESGRFLPAESLCLGMDPGEISTRQGRPTRSDNILPPEACITALEGDRPACAGSIHSPSGVTFG